MRTNILRHCAAAVPMLLVMFFASVAVCAEVPTEDALAQENAAEQTAISETQSEAENGETVLLKLDADQNESLVIEKGQSVVLDLNGYTLKSDEEHTIINYGTLTIIDSSANTGKIVNENRQYSALLNATDATANVNGGNIIGEGGYVIKNYGTMVIDGAIVEQEDSTTSSITNGWYDGEQADEISSVDCDQLHTGVEKATLTIKSGEFSGGTCVLKNDDWGVLVIEGGNFFNDVGTILLNWNKALIKGGTFTVTDSDSAIINLGYTNDVMDEGSLNIEGGDFNTYGNGLGVLITYAPDSAEGCTLQISGGTFDGLS